jgi:N-acetylated-alpha-linked acidic dipeptidase
MGRLSAGAWTAITGASVVTALLLMGDPAQPGRQAPIDGFAPASAAAQHDVERRLARFVSSRRLIADHRFLTAEPHVAGSPRDRQLAEWTRDQWIAAGLDSAEIVEHDVLLPSPRDASVEMLAPHPWRATLREHAHEPMAFHAYGASGDVTAHVIDAGTGTRADFDRLAARGVDVRGTILLVRYPDSYSYRGYTVYLAQQRGAAAVLMYGASPDAGIQRGGVGFDFLAPGDPTTPGWASTPDARRLPRADAHTLPAIMSIPLSTRDAHAILDALRGGEVTLRVRVENDEAIRPIWTVIGRINGSTHPDQWVIAGNHRDAWVYGGVDPSSGSAVIMEMARALGALVRLGARPRRTILLASWDAEELAMTSSTEWGEQHELELREKAVAYLNVDAAVSGSTFAASAVPSLAHAVASTAGVADSAIETRIGAGSDYAVFLNFLGVPIVDMRFQGPYDVYHSAFDTHEWVARVDPRFLRHAELTRVWASLATRLANADLLPLDQVRYARRIRTFLSDVERRWGTSLEIASDALARFEEAAIRDAEVASSALGNGDATTLDLINRALMEVEPSFTDAAGLEGRPWYRHQLYAPAFTYAPEVLPALSEAVDARDAEGVARAERRLADALTRAAESLKVFTTIGPRRAS